MSLYPKLYDFQRNIVDKFMNKSAFGLFLDMGLGKTITALAMAEVNNCDKVIVVTINPKACETVDDKGSWQYWASYSKFGYRIHSKWMEPQTTDKPDCFVVNYESLFKRGRGKNKPKGLTLNDSIWNFINECRQHNVALIIDESHKVKNLQSQQTKAIQKIQRELKRIANRCVTYLLTGTPFTQGYVDLYSQLYLLGCDMTKGEFVDMFCIRGNVPGLLGWQQPIVGYKNVNTLFNLLHRYAITVKSEDVIDLPEKIFDYHELKSSTPFKVYTQEQLKLSEIADFAEDYDIDPHSIIVSDGKDFFARRDLTETLRIVKKLDKKFNNPWFRDIDYPQSRWIAETSGQCWLRARQLSIGFNGNANDFKWYDRTRLNAIKRFLEDNEDNYLLFYNYTPELLELYDICEELGYNIDVYCGEIKSLHFYKKFSNLSDSEKLVNRKNIILANFSSGSTGLNWQEYSHCILASVPTFKDYAQAIKRLHRDGQKHNVVYHVFFGNNWLDNGMLNALRNSVEYDSTMFEADIARVQALTSGTP